MTYYYIIFLPLEAYITEYIECAFCTCWRLYRHYYKYCFQLCSLFSFLLSCSFPPCLQTSLRVARLKFEPYYKRSILWVFLGSTRIFTLVFFNLLSFHTFHLVFFYYSLKDHLSLSKRSFYTVLYSRVHLYLLKYFKNLFLSLVLVLAADMRKCEGWAPGNRLKHAILLCCLMKSFCWCVCPACMHLVGRGVYCSGPCLSFDFCWFHSFAYLV